MLAPNTVRIIGGVSVPVVILGDPAYPLLLWLMKPYPGAGLSVKEKIHVQVMQSPVVVECDFGRLKGRWRSLLN